MPNGDVAPGCVLPTCGLGHHQVAARPCARGRSVAAVPMNGSMSSRMAALYPLPAPRRFQTGELPVDLVARLSRMGQPSGLPGEDSTFGGHMTAAHAQLPPGCGLIATRPDATTRIPAGAEARTVRVTLAPGDPAAP